METHILEKFWTRSWLNLCRNSQFLMLTDPVIFLLKSWSDLVITLDRILIREFDLDPYKNLIKFFRNPLSWSWGSSIGSWENPDRNLKSRLRKISEQELEKILNRILFHLDKSWKQEFLGFETGSWIKLGRILEIQDPDRSFQGFSRNEQDWD